MQLTSTVAHYDLDFPCSHPEMILEEKTAWMQLHLKKLRRLRIGYPVQMAHSPSAKFQLPFETERSL